MEQLETLKNAYSAAQDKVLAHSKEVSAKVEAIIARECKALNVEPIFRLSLRESWRGDCLVVEGGIAFKTDDPECISKGRTQDFGSDFSIEVSAEEVKINHGCIGTYSLKDKYQIARDRLIARIWDIHDELTKVVADNADPAVFKELHEASFAYDKLEREIKHAEEQKKLDAAARLLESSKYLFDVVDRNRYDEHCNMIGKRRCYREVFEIEKVTSASVIGHYKSYSWQTRRLNRADVLSGLAYGSKAAANEILQDYDL